MSKKPAYEELEKRVRDLEKKAAERTQAEEQLRSSEERFRNLIEGSIQGILIHKDHKPLFVNKAYADIYGYDPDEILEMENILPLFAEEEHARIISYMKSRLNGEEAPSQYEYKGLRKDGSPVWLENTVRVVDWMGETTIQTAVFDITERKRAEEELREYREHLEARVEGRMAELTKANEELQKEVAERKQAEEAVQSERDRAQMYLDVAGVMLLAIDPEGKVTLVNKKGCEILGYEEDEILGKNWFDHFLPEENKETLKDVFHRLLNGEIEPVEYYENRILTKANEDRDIAWHNTVLRNRDGKIAGTFSSGEDITERKRAEEALRDSERQKKAILDASVDRIRLIDPDMKIIWANETTTKELNMDRGDIIGQYCYELLFDRDTPCEGCPTEKALLSGEIEHGVVHQPKSKGIEGETYWDDYAVPIKDESGEIVNLIQITRNITASKKAEEENKRLQAQLYKAQKMQAIGTLAGGIAHDFNNILYPILGYTEMTLEDLPEDTQSYGNLKEVLKAANRAKGLVQQILTFSRQSEQERRPLRIQSIIKEALQLLRASIPSNIEIKHDIEDDCGVIEADPIQIHQVMMNLCTNAYHAMREKGGELRVTLREVNLDSWVTGFRMNVNPGRYLRLTVSDTGHGMERHILEKIFDPYFTTKAPGEGTGMGLAVVHGIVRSYGGDVTVYSEPGEGTSLHVYFPRIQSRPYAPKPMTHEPAEEGREHILLVDDEEQIVRMVRQMLERLGYRVTARTSSVEALEAFRVQPEKFDLVITDQSMPNMTGGELAREMLAIRHDIGIILCTGFSEVMTEDKAKAIGIREYVMKPVVKSEISRAIRKVLGQREEN